jgi:hypothetical protein
MISPVVETAGDHLAPQAADQFGSDAAIAEAELDQVVEHRRPACSGPDAGINRGKAPGSQARGRRMNVRICPAWRMRRR